LSQSFKPAGFHELHRGARVPASTHSLGRELFNDLEECLNHFAKSLSVILLSAATGAAATGAMAQQAFSSSAASLVDSSEPAGVIRPVPQVQNAPARSFGQVAFGAGISPEGVTMSATTNLNRYMNVRGTGSVFNYTINNFITNGFNVGGKLNLASAGASLDFYPFPNHGFRLSPGVLFYNKNGASTTFDVVPGTSFTLNDYTYYASKTNPVMGTGALGLHTQNPAFTATTGWGNQIRRGNGHWSFPVEVGVAFIGKPHLNIALTQGQVCNANGLNCVNVATDKDVQANLQAQIAKYRSDLDPLKTYPIVSFGVAYSFHTRSAVR
jgi:hypothetical protein